MRPSVQGKEIIADDLDGVEPALPCHLGPLVLASCAFTSSNVRLVYPKASAISSPP